MFGITLILQPHKVSHLSNLDLSEFITDELWANYCFFPAVFGGHFGGSLIKPPFEGRPQLWLTVSPDLSLKKTLPKGLVRASVSLVCRTFSLRTCTSLEKKNRSQWKNMSLTSRLTCTTLKKVQRYILYMHMTYYIYLIIHILNTIVYIKKHDNMYISWHWRIVH